MKLKSVLFKKVMAVVVALSMLLPLGITQAVAAKSRPQSSQNEVHGSVAPINPEYLEYIKNGASKSGESPSLLDLSYLAKRYADSSISTFSLLPESYDLRDYGLVGPVPDQGDYGTCWTFGSLGSAESSLMKKQFSFVDLSKKHLAWFSGTGDEEREFYLGKLQVEDYDPYQIGGDDITTLAALAAWKGPIYSDKMPYEPSESVNESLRYAADLHLQDCVYTYKTTFAPTVSPTPDGPDPQLIKRLIMENGAYEIAYDSESYGNQYYNESTFAVYHDKDTPANHSTLIVGWDDRFSKENFANGCQPENDGAWLVRNSWGTSWGDDGYFWLSYEDKTLDIMGSSYTFEDKDNYAKNYQYDINGWAFSAAADDFSDVSKALKTAYISNIFTAETNEQLEAVSFYTTDVGTEYEISVYTDVNDNDPVSGKLVYSGQTGREEYCGYHTVELTNAVALKKGTKFSVVVKLQNPDYAYPIATEGSIFIDSNYQPQYMGNGGESYYSADGKSWTDIVELGKHAINFANSSQYGLYTSNVCLKAFTNPLPESGEAIGNVDFSLFEGEVALGSTLELSGAENIHYTLTPLDGSKGDVLEYTAPIVITEPCTVTAWGEKNGKAGNMVAKTYTKQVSRLTDLAIKNSTDKGTIHLNTENLDQIIFLDGINEKMNLRPCGKDEITVNGIPVKSDEWSQDILLTAGEVNEVTVKTEKEGKQASVYTLKIYLAPFKYNYEKETINFDDTAYTITDEQNQPIKSGDSISQYITEQGEQPKLFTVKNNKSGDIRTLSAGQRPSISFCGIDYQKETTNYQIGTTTYISYNEDMSDCVAGSNDRFPIVPGKTIYLKRAATDCAFASTVHKIDPPARPKTPVAEIEETGADYIVLSEIKNGEYRILPDGEWQTDNYFGELDPDTEYTFEARIASTDDSFVSLADSATVKTHDGVSVNVRYEAFGHTVFESSAVFPEGKTTYYPDQYITEMGYFLSENDAEEGKTVTVKNDGGVLTADTDELVFEVTANVNPSDFSYTVNYWTEDGKKLKSCPFTFNHTEVIDISELKIPDGYEAVRLVDQNAEFAAALIYYKGQWIVQGKEINLVVKQLSSTTLRIVHTNDIHGYYTATNRGVIGFAKLKALSDFVGADLILDAGDTYHGQAFATVEKGLGIAELMKEVGYDAMTPGNHDWSYGADRLKELENVQDFPILAANVTDKSGNDYFNTPYIVKTVTADDGTQLKVGIVGVIDSGFYDSTASDNVKDVIFKEQAATASAIAKTLKEKENCSIVIALTHSSDCQSFVSGLSDVDAVIAGHQHILIDKSYNDKNGKSVLVVEAGYYFNNIGVLSLTYDTQKGCLSRAEEKYYTAENLKEFVADSAVNAKIKEIENRENDILSKIIGKSKTDYPYSWEEIRVAEQQIGRIVTAAYLDRTGADVAFENAGGIRGGIPKGDITYKDLIGISPYGNTIVTKELTGKQILALVEYSLELSRQCDEIYSLQKAAAAKGEDYTQYKWPKNSGSVLQFGGITVKFDMTKPSGSRIVTAQIGGETVDPDRVYVVATNNYAAENTDYPDLSKAPLLKDYGTCEQALLSYIAKGTFEEAAEKANLSAYKPDENSKSNDNSNDKPNDSSNDESNDKSEDKSDSRPESDVNSESLTSAQSENVKQSISSGANNSPNTGVEGVTVIFAALEIISAAAIAVLFKKRSKDNLKK